MPNYSGGGNSAHGSAHGPSGSDPVSFQADWFVSTASTPAASATSPWMWFNPTSAVLYRKADDNASYVQVAASASAAASATVVANVITVPTSSTTATNTTSRSVLFKSAATNTGIIYLGQASGTALTTTGGGSVVCDIRPDGWHRADVSNPNLMTYIGSVANQVMYMTVYR